MRIPISGSFPTVLAVLLVIALSGGNGVDAQGPPSSSDADGHRFTELELMMKELEVKQEMTEKALDQSNEQYRWLLTGIGAIIAIMVTLQGFISVTQMRREQSRYVDYFKREKKRDDTDQSSTDRLASIYGVLRDTLESRLTLQEEEHERAKEAEKELRDVLEKVEKLTKFVDRFEDRIREERTTIEKSARELAALDRHEFRGQAKELNRLVDKFDSYHSTLGGVSDTEDVPWTSHVPFVRGIAAHFSNQPETAVSCFKEVVATRVPETGETEIEFDRRQATAYYYLGMTQSNFGFVKDANDYFEKANEKDLGGKDYLSRIVTADACLMSGDYDRAHEYISQVLDTLRKEEQRKGSLLNSELRNRSRATLIQATMLISLREPGWKPKAIQLLREVHSADPNYYFATCTLAGIDPDNSRALFTEAYEAIEVSGHLNTVTEVRSRILLLMVAGMCCRYGSMDTKRSDQYLDLADELRSKLPILNSRKCYVFSTLSFRNEKSEKIAQHIENIRNGKLLL